MEENAVLKKEAPTDKPPRAPWSKKTKIIVWSIVGAVVIAAIVIGIVFGVRANQYKMRTFKKDGVTYEQYALEASINPAEVCLRSPRGDQEYYPDYIEGTIEQDNLANLVRKNDVNRIRYFTAFTSTPLPDQKDKKYKSYYHVMLRENDHKWHYYNRVTNGNSLVHYNDKKFKRLSKKHKYVIYQKKANNPIITGWVNFGRGLLLYVDHGIVTRLQLDGNYYTIS